MKLFDIVTIFPEMCAPYVEGSILGRAQKSKKIKIRVHQLREFSRDKHHKVDDMPYGGGPGMVMQVEPFDRALKKIKKTKGTKKIRVILTSASGKTFTQIDAARLSKYDQLIFLCGRYEGIDARVENYLADEALSIGDYVLTGGELPALVMTDAVARLVPGVLGAEASLTEESHTEEGVLEYPQYTRPAEYLLKGKKDGKGKKDEKVLKVPEVLLSGDHKKIEQWRKEQQKKQ